MRNTRCRFVLPGLFSRKQNDALVVFLVTGRHPCACSASLRLSAGTGVKINDRQQQAAVGCA